MKNLLLSFLVLTTLISCKQATKDYVTFSGKIENTTDTVLTIRSRTFTKNIAIKNDGSFKDTLKVDKAGYFALKSNGKEKSFLFLRNGFNLNLTTKGVSFTQNINYTGIGASTNNYLVAQYGYGKSLGSAKQYFVLEKDIFLKKVQKIKSDFDSIKSMFTDIDTTIVRLSNIQNQGFFDILEKNYEKQHTKTLEKLDKNNRLLKGKPSPKFKNYENFIGGKTSLDDFKGTYVYIDVWATWCRPCLAEIPALKSLEKQYHGKNIQFISISIDDERTAGSWENANKKWRKMVKSKNLSGIQLYAGQDLEFIQEYEISSIPRFLLIDPKGNIVSSNAPRPSDPQLLNIFNELGI